jgi:Ras-related GTP-binding protein A/B
LNLWDCGGQWGFIDSYLTEDGQKSVFASCGALIYCFEVTKLDASGRAPVETIQYFERCLQALRNQSPRAPVFVLIQKMDLVNPARRQADFDLWVDQVKNAAGDTPFTAFGTSIHEDTLYRVRMFIHLGLL